MNRTRFWAALAACAAAAITVYVGVSVLVDRDAQGLTGPAEAGAGLLSDAFLLRDFHSKRASSWNRSGMNADYMVVPAGETRSLLEEPGAGCIRHFYWAYIEGDEAKRHDLFRGTVLRAFWDGAGAPSIEVPLGDFFGVSNGQIKPVKSLAFTTNPGHSGGDRSWGFNCYLPMAFSSGARIELENQTDQDARLWFHIDYQLYDSSSAVPANAGRLHALWNRENPTEGVPFPKGPDPRNLKNRWQIENLSGDENYAILDVDGNGQFVGYFLTVVNIQDDPWTWWGEGDDMVFIDGEGFPPSIHGTGSEEIFGGGACPATEYTGPYTGFHRVENLGGERWLGTNGMYRFYLTDPLRFRTSIRVTIEHGHGNNKSNDYSSVAFWYQQGVNANLPPLPPPADRNCTTNN